jgi:protoporphyrinogen/coproporphyrinogen III oxidase
MAGKDTQRVGIIGAGISGLVLAYYLQKLGIDYVLLEATDQVGGYIRSQQVDDYLLELGPNSLLCDAEMEEFLDEIGLKSLIEEANPVGKNRFVFRDGAYRSLPASPPKLITGGFFSWKTKFKIFSELSNRSQSVQNETVHDFFVRHFGNEVAQYAMNPFVRGIYAGDPTKLILAKTFPALLRYERENGSVLKSLIKQGVSMRRKTLSFKGGMQTLPKTIAQTINQLYLESPLQKIEKQNSLWILHTAKQTFECSDLVLTGTAFGIAPLIGDLYPVFAQELRNIYYAPVAAVHTAFERSKVEHSLEGFGSLNPQREGRFSLGHIWSSSIFDGRVPDGQVLFTTFVGGTAEPHKTQLSADDIKKQVSQELSEAFGISGKPVFQQLYLWEKAIPQYHLEALAAQQTAENLEQERLYCYTSWAGRGVGLADAFKNSKELAMRIAK